MDVDEYNAACQMSRDCIHLVRSVAFIYARMRVSLADYRKRVVKIQQH